MPTFAQSAPHCAQVEPILAFPVPKFVCSDIVFNHEDHEEHEGVIKYIEI